MNKFIYSIAVIAIFIFSFSSVEASTRNYHQGYTNGSIFDEGGFLNMGKFTGAWQRSAHQPAYHPSSGNILNLNMGRFTGAWQRSSRKSTSYNSYSSRASNYDSYSNGIAGVSFFNLGRFTGAWQRSAHQ